MFRQAIDVVSAIRVHSQAVEADVESGELVVVARPVDLVGLCHHFGVFNLGWLPQLKQPLTLLVV